MLQEEYKEKEIVKSPGNFLLCFIFEQKSCTKTIDMHTPSTVKV
jgi:hypothetical protein